jgi:hypothetical protein
MAGKKGKSSKPRKKRPTAAQQREAEKAKKFQEVEWAKEQARRQKTKTKKLMRGLTREKIEQLKDFEADPLRLRREAELMIVKSLPDPAKITALEPVIKLKFELNRIVAGQSFHPRFEMLQEAVKAMLEGQKNKVRQMVDLNQGSGIQKRWLKRRKEVEGLLNRLDAYRRRVAEAGRGRENAIRKILQSKTVWIKFFKEAEDALQVGLGTRENKDYFQRQMEKIREHITF